MKTSDFEDCNGEVTDPNGRSRESGLKYFPVEGWIRVAHGTSDIYNAFGEAYFYPGNRLDFVRRSSSFGWRIRPGDMLKTLVIITDSSGNKLTPDIRYSFGFVCNESNLETTDTFYLPSDFSGTVAHVIWKAAPNFITGVKIGSC